MKILIIGHSVVDHLYDESSERTFPGGIFYSTIGFRSQAKEADELFLLTSSAKDDSKYFEKAFHGFNLDYANNLPALSHVNLYLDGTAERREHYVKTVEPLQISEEINLNEFDGIFINMITGNDLTAEQFEMIRQNYSGKIFMDVHTLSRGMGHNHHRFFRKIPNYENYLNSVDLIQVNEHELKTITPYDEKEKVLETVFKHNIKCLILTKGSEGAEIFTNDGNSYQVDAIEINSINKVGCGDVFGSVFFYLYLSGVKFEDALKQANYAAGVVTSLKTEEEFLQLKNAII